MEHRALLLSAVHASRGATFTIEVLTRSAHAQGCDLDMGSLAFALLRDDHIIVAADRRHTRGDLAANYRNDVGFKTMTILSDNGVLGFAGHDIGEQILIPAKNSGKLDGTSLESVAREFADWSKARYRDCVPDFATIDRPPSVQFLLAGFAPSSNGTVATAYILQSPEFVPLIAQFPYRKFEIIGRSGHGALYALHRFGEQTKTVESGLRLAALVLSEISECDTTIGGLPELFVIQKGEKVAGLSEMASSRLDGWAKAAGEKLAKEILDPAGSEE